MASKIKAAKTENKVSTKPPVVAILGHVDHGKTSLLDFIRKSHVAAKEAGGITQHIGAYQISHKGRKVTFIDTPGHEAFSAMRARGGQVSDVALLIVAADDGVMPQTKESIAHIKAANIPFIVVINKMDMPGASIEKTKKQLAESEVLVEGYGGEVPVVPVSAKTGQGVDDLLEMINLVSDMREVKEESSKEFKGVIIESKLDKFRGPVATVLIKDGVLKQSDPIATETAPGKIKSMTDSDGKKLDVASASTPVEILGFSTVPKVGEIVTISTGPHKEVKKEEAKRLSTLDRVTQENTSEIRLIIKADFTGSLEAITNALEDLKGENKQVKVYYSETGDITEGDVLLSAATKSLIIGFNVNINPSAQRLAKEEKVLISQYKLIYELLNELKEGLDAISQRAEETILGSAEVLAIFTPDGKKIVGSKVTEGRINKTDTIALKRDDKEIGRSKIISMKHKETDISQANENDEFGLVAEKDLPFTKGDIIVAIGSA